MERLLAGDQETEAHFSKYFGELLQIKLRARLRSAQLIEDIRQETFLRVFRSLRQGSVQHPERIGAFVNAVCNNVMMEQIRASARSSPAGEEYTEFPDSSPHADTLLINDERLQQVRKILGELPAKDRDLLRAVFINEEDKDAVCLRFNVDRQYLRVLLHRARARMRQEFRKVLAMRLLFAFFAA